MEVTEGHKIIRKKKKILINRGLDHPLTKVLSVCDVGCMHGGYAQQIMPQLSDLSLYVSFDLRLNLCFEDVILPILCLFLQWLRPCSLRTMKGLVHPLPRNLLNLLQQSCLFRSLTLRRLEHIQHLLQLVLFCPSSVYFSCHVS